MFEGLKNKTHNSRDGVPYGVPHGRGPNLLIWNTDEVEPQSALHDRVDDVRSACRALTRDRLGELGLRVWF